MNCYNCDTLLENNWNYCPNCKRKLRKNKIVEEEFVACNEVGKCHTCSCDLNDNWNFCPICGTSAEFYSEKPSVVLPTIATDADNKPAIVPDVSNENSEIEENVLPEKYCPKCGAKVIEEHLFCASCGNSLKEESVPVVQEEKVKTRDDNLYILWIVIAYAVTPLGFIISPYIGEWAFYVGYIVSLFSIIYAKIAYPKNKIVKVFFWLFIILSILAILFFGIVIAAFMFACGYCVEAYS